MQNEATTEERLIIHGDGTVTDSKTDLMWTISIFGKNIYSKICEGEVNGFMWTEAVELFGRGRKIPTEKVKNRLCLNFFWLNRKNSASNKIITLSKRQTGH